MSQVTRWPPTVATGAVTIGTVNQGSGGVSPWLVTGTVTSSGTSTVTGTVSTDINGLANFKTTKYTIGTSAVQLVTPALANRSSVSFKAVCTGAAAIFIGNSAGVTTATGYILFNGDSLQLDLTGATSPYAISDTPGQTLYVLEIG